MCSLLQTNTPRCARFQNDKQKVLFVNKHTKVEILNQFTLSVHWAKTNCIALKLVLSDLMAVPDYIHTCTHLHMYRGGRGIGVKGVGGIGVYIHM